MINYFNFRKLNNRYLITNDLGRYMFVTNRELKSLITDNVDMNSEFGQVAAQNFFCFSGSEQAFSNYVKPYMRESKNYLFSSTSLHIFVVTNSCNMQCVYCQAQKGDCVPNEFMTKETAEGAVDIALSSPEKHLTFEFQGGEPLLNFDIIKHIVEYTKIKNTSKIIEFNLVSNLTMLNESIVDFIKENKIGLSTSIDGDQLLHNQNRTYRNGKGSFEDAVSGIRTLQKAGIFTGAIQTTTRNSLTHSKEIVDTYLELGLNNLFVRPLTPLGRANKSWESIGYSAKEFVDFYKKCFDYIIELNSNGIYLKEGHASIMLSKILEGRPVNYMELRSPCGAAIGQMAYNYNGDIYTCDEGRMLAEMGNDVFKLGNVYTSSYDDLINCENCKAVCVSSTLESLPNCFDCVYNPYCGTCPVVNFALKNDIINKEPNDYRCTIYRGILNVIFEALQDDKKAEILKTWL